MMISPILAGLMAVQAPATGGAQSSALSVENTTIVRCSAAFALIAQKQVEGDPSATQWPPLGERGREFFVRALADLMDDTGFGREQIARLVQDEARRLQGSAELDQIMPACLLMLDGSGI